MKNNIPPRSSLIILIILSLIACDIVIKDDYWVECFISRPVVIRTNVLDRMALFAATKGFGGSSGGSKKKGKKTLIEEEEKPANRFPPCR